MDFLDIPMDGLEELNELDEYLVQPIEKVHDPISWWWDHKATFPCLSIMAFDYLSVPGKFRLSNCEFLLIDVY
jgi:hAT family C-terminal dimerisation region